MKTFHSRSKVKEEWKPEEDSKSELLDEERRQFARRREEEEPESLQKCLKYSQLSI